jgi:hypothetical protein
MCESTNLTLTEFIVDSIEPCYGTFIIFYEVRFWMNQNKFDLHLINYHTNVYDDVPTFLRSEFSTCIGARFLFPNFVPRSVSYFSPLSRSFDRHVSCFPLFLSFSKDPYSRIFMAVFPPAPSVSDSAFPFFSTHHALILHWWFLILHFFPTSQRELCFFATTSCFDSSLVSFVSPHKEN